MDFDLYKYALPIPTVGIGSGLLDFSLSACYLGTLKGYVWLTFLKQIIPPRLMRLLLR